MKHHGAAFSRELPVSQAGPDALSAINRPDVNVRAVSLSRLRRAFPFAEKWRLGVYYSRVLPLSCCICRNISCIRSSVAAMISAHVRSSSLIMEGTSAGDL